MPSRVDAQLRGTVDKQIGMLRDRQAKRPKLNFRVPSLLEAVAYWYTLRAQGDKLADGSTFTKTYIRHFNLEPQRFGGWSYVPRSCVRDDGGPALGRSVVEVASGARLLVG
jgi:hypothetical protein